MYFDAYSSLSTSKSKSVPSTPRSKTIAVIVPSSLITLPSNCNIEPHGRFFEEATILTVP